MEVANTEGEMMDCVSQELRCVVCYSVFVDPRVLKCQHCFCLRCLFLQVNYDRGERLIVTCPFRCHEETITRGDIRTLPRNLLVTNISQVVRKKMFPNIPFIKSEEKSSPKSDGTAIKYECEWCSRESETCKLCSSCYSVLCIKCRGPFSNHHFLCDCSSEALVSRRPESPLTKAYNDVELNAIENDAQRASHSSLRDHQRLFSSLAVTINEVEGQHYPFLLTQKVASKLLVSHLEETKQVAPISIKIEEIEALRIATQQSHVTCTQSASGFSSSYDVIPKFTLGPLEINVDNQHWGMAQRGSTALLLLSNVIRLGQKKMEDILAVCREVNNLLHEVKSVARRALVMKNRGFQLYACHVMQLGREEVVIVRNLIVPQMVRLRHLESLIGDAVVNRYHQVYSQMIPSERHSVRSRCVSFTRIELMLVKQLDALLKRIYTKSVDLDGYIDSLGKELISLSDSLNDTACEAERLLSSSSAPPCPSAKGPSVEEKKRAWWFSQHRKSSHKPEVADVSRNVYTDTTFAGQFRERRSTTENLTRYLLQSLNYSLIFRYWSWYFTNTTCREIGLSEEECDVLIEGEEEMQSLYDRVVETLWRGFHFSSQWEILILKMEKSNFSFDASALVKRLVRQDGYKNSIFFNFEAIEGTLQEMRRLREYLCDLQADVNTFGNVRSFETQSELVNVVSSLIKAGQEHNAKVLSGWCNLEESQIKTIFYWFKVDTVGSHIEEPTITPIPCKSTSATLPSAFIQSVANLEESQFIEEFLSNEETGAPLPTPTDLGTLEVNTWKKKIVFGKYIHFGSDLQKIANGEVGEEDPNFQVELPTLFPDAPHQTTSNPNPKSFPRSYFFMFKTDQMRAEEESRGETAEKDTAAAVAAAATPEKNEVYSTESLHWVDESLFAAETLNCSRLAVLQSRPIKEDPLGKLKASSLFKGHFRFTASSTEWVSSEKLTLPFYVGLYSYKQGKRLYPFAVDAQTGQVWTVSPTEETRSLSSYVAVIVSSPLFFILFNVIMKQLSIESSRLCSLGSFY